MTWALYLAWTGLRAALVLTAGGWPPIRALRWSTTNTWALWQFSRGAAQPRRGRAG